MIARAEIETLIPHAASMCLLDEVLAWDTSQIECRSRTHLDLAHPLRHNSALSGLHLIEYGAQAAAIHGGLLAREAGQPVSPGLLVAVRDLKLTVERIDEIAAPLEIRARRLLTHGGGWLYEFVATAAQQVLAQGRISIIAT